MRYFTFLIMLLLFSCNKTKISKIQSLPDESTALIIDNSYSMLSPDFQPNRLTVIKKAVQNIINRKKETQAFSLVVYSSESYILCPLTKDKTQLLAAVNKLDTVRIKKMPWGTSFTHALLNGITSLRLNSKKKSIVLFSDGKENRQWWYSGKIPIEIAFKNKIKINTVMIMSKDSIIASIIFDIKDKIQYQKQKATPEDSIELKKISLQTGGSFKFFNSKEKVLGFNFNSWISEKNKTPIKTGLYPIDNEELKKVYEITKATNDRLYIEVNK